jgi:hypothetical protein
LGTTLKCPKYVISLSRFTSNNCSRRHINHVWQSLEVEAKEVLGVRRDVFSWKVKLLQQGLIDLEKKWNMKLVGGFMGTI